MNFKLGRKKDLSTGKWVSMGFGFASFKNKENANKALKSMQGHVVDNYELELKFSSTSTLKHVEKKPARKEDPVQEEDTKIVVKNLPFQATKQ